MISIMSLRSPRRRLPELRRAHGKLRSLKRERFARRIFSRKIGPDLAITHLFDSTIEFLGCTFSEYNDPISPIRRAVNRMNRALTRMKQECVAAATQERAIPSAAIRQYGSAATHLYKVTRHSSVKWDCDETWSRLGLCAHTLF
jgi:hypothetical protein